MTPLEALVELTNMGVDEKRINATTTGKLPRLYEIVMEECSPPENWVHLIGDRTPCDSELRFVCGAGGVYVCDEHDRRVVRDAPKRSDSARCNECHGPNGQHYRNCSMGLGF